MTDNIVTELEHVESTIRAQDAAAAAELRRLRADVTTAHERDVENYGQALADGQAPPKPVAGQMHKRINDLERRVIPGVDEALWQLAGKVRLALRPDADDSFIHALDAQRPRWEKPLTTRDPSGILRTGRADLKHRPANVVRWMVDGIELLEAFQAEAAEKKEADARQRSASAAVGAAQAAYEREQQRSLDEQEATMSPGAVASRHLAQARPGTPPWEPFDRYKWLREHDLLDDYGYVQPGMVIQAKGGRERRIEQVPASNLLPTATPA